MRSLAESQIVLATNNEGKIREYNKLFETHPITVIPSNQLNIFSPPETATTFEDNARIKAEHAMCKSGMISLAEDSGLEVGCLNDAPGVATADWAKRLTGRDYDSAMHQVWNNILACDAQSNPLARFRAVICVNWPDGELAYFSGAVCGKIVWPPRGTGGFGYDPIFMPESSEQTFAEMTIAEKSLFSHRAEALKSLASHCLDN